MGWEAPPALPRDWEGAVGDYTQAPLPTCQELGGLIQHRGAPPASVSPCMGPAMFSGLRTC